MGQRIQGEPPGTPRRIVTQHRGHTGVAELVQAERQHDRQQENAEQQTLAIEEQTQQEGSPGPAGGRSPPVAQSSNSAR